MAIKIPSVHSRSFIACLVLGGTCLLVMTVAPISGVLNLFHDDSFFYLVIARNHAAGLGYSFDGLNLTNGFHPFWLWMLSGLGSVIALTGDGGIRAVLLLQTVISIAAALLYVRLLARTTVSGFMQILFFIAYVFLCTLADVGQESALFSLLVALVVSLLLKKSLDNKPSAAPFLQILALVVLASLCVLARLDCVFLLGAFTLALLIARRKKEGIALILGTSLGLGIAFSFNYTLFGHGYSISSWLKSGFDLNKALQILIPGLLVRVGLVYLLLGGALWRLKRVHAFSILRSTLSKVSFAALLTLCVFLAYTAYFAVLFLEVSALGSWYFNQALGLSLFLYALAYQHHRQPLLITSQNSVHTFSYLPLLLALGIGVALFSSKWMWAHSSDATREMGQWLAANTKSSDVIFQRDGAGAVSYFAQRPIINGDGLVNNMQYQVMLRTGRLCHYLKDQKVQYLVSNTFVNTSGLIQDYIFLWTKGLVSLPLTNVAPSVALYTTNANPQYRVFRLAEAGTGCEW